MTELIHPLVKKIEPVNEEKSMLKSEIERTTTDDVTQISTSQVKLGKEFYVPIIINDMVDTIMKDVAPDRKEEKIDKVVDSKYLQPRWCPPGLTRTQTYKLQCLQLAKMREKEQEKRQDELFNENKPVTMPKQECRRKETPLSSTAELATGGQTVAPGGPTTADSVPGGPTASPGSQTALAKEKHGPITSQDGSIPNSVDQRTETSGSAGAASSPTMVEGGLTVSLGSPTASSCRMGTSSGADGTSSPAAMEEDSDDDLLNYEPSPIHNGVKINVVYLSSTD
jgi:hypothetical protein